MENTGLNQVKWGRIWLHHLRIWGVPFSSPRSTVACVYGNTMDTGLERAKPHHLHNLHFGHSFCLTGTQLEILKICLKETWNAKFCLGKTPHLHFTLSGVKSDSTTETVPLSRTVSHDSLDFPWQQTALDSLPEPMYYILVLFSLLFRGPCCASVIIQITFIFISIYWDLKSSFI